MKIKCPKCSVKLTVSKDVAKLQLQCKNCDAKLTLEKLKTVKISRRHKIKTDPRQLRQRVNNMHFFKQLNAPYRLYKNTSLFRLFSF